MTPSLSAAGALPLTGAVRRPRRGDAPSRPDPTPAGPAGATSVARHGSLPAALDEIGFTRAHVLIMGLVLAGMFFDTLEQDSTGAIGPYLVKTFDISHGQLILINTVTTVGGLLGRLLAGYIGDRFGRRTALSVNLLIYTMAGVISAIAPNYEVLLASRFVVGIGLGGEFTIGLAIISEMVATKRRGSAVAALNVGAGGIGNFAAYGLFVLILGPLNGLLGGDEHSWRWLLALLAVPAVLVVAFRRYLPESPRFLLSRGRVDETNRVLSTLASGRLAHRSQDVVVTRFIDESAVPEDTSDASPTELLRGAYPRRIAVLGIASWMAFGAQVTLLVLLPTLLVSKGFSVSSSLLFTMIMYGGSALGAFAAMAVAGRLPRRTTVSVAALLGAVTAVLYAELANGAVLILVLGSLFQFFALFLNTTLATWSPELFGTRVRALGTSVVNGIGNVGGAVMPFAAVFFFDRAGVAGVFLMLAVMYAALVVAARFGPETLGRTLEDVNDEDAPAVAVPA